MGDYSSEPQGRTPVENSGESEDVKVEMRNGAKNGTKVETEKQDEEEKPKVVGFGELFKYSDWKDRLLMVLGFICACTHGAGLPVLMVVFGEVTDLFVNNANPNISLANMNLTAPSGPGLFDEMKKFSLYYFIVGLVVLVVAYGQVAFWLMASYRQAFKIRLALFRSIMRQEIAWFDMHEIGELNTRLTDDVNKIQEGTGEKIGNFLQWMTCFFTGIIIGFAYGWKLALVILAFTPLLAACGIFMTKLTTISTSAELKAYAKAGAVAEEAFGAIRTVVAFGGEKKECHRYGSNLKEAQAVGVRKGLIAGGGLGALFFIIFCVYALAFWYGSKLVREDPDYSAGRMLIVFFSVLIGAFSLGNATPNLGNVATARGAAFTVYHIIQTVPKIDSESEEGEKPQQMEGNIVFRDVVFRYPSRPELTVLKGLDLRVSKGQTVALVGASGCGKSTVVQLLQRFYDPEQGAIFIDGKNVCDLNVRWLRQHIGLVSQEPILFGTTIAENIRFGRQDVTQAEIEQACKEANAHNFIKELPQRYDTLVGERGAQLSGGQKQRIAIARALVRNPKILLLDEATSALDVESEATVQAALDKVRLGRTTLVIAHRLSTIRTADIIIGISEGKVAEMGTHEELMAQGGIYYTLVTNQTSGEEDPMDGVSSTVSLKRHESIRTSSRKLVTQASVKSAVVSTEEEEEDLPDPDMMRLFRLNAPEAGYIAIGCIMAILNGGVQPAFALVFAEILGVYALPLNEQAEKALMYSLIFIAIGVGQGIAMLGQSYFFAKAGEALTVRLRSMAFRCMIGQDIAFFDDHKNSVGALTARLATDASAVQGVTGARLGTMFQSLASIGTGLIIGFIFSWKLTLAIIAFVPFILVGGLLEMKILQGSSTEGKEALETASKHATEAIENMRTVASLTREQTFLQIYRENLEPPYKRRLRTTHFTGFAFSFTQALIFFAYAAAFTLGAYLVEQRELEFHNLFKVFFAIVMSAMGAGQATAFAPDYGKGKSAASRILMLFDSEPSINSFSEEGDTNPNGQGSLTFESIKFSYPTRSTVIVLKGLSFQVQPGQTVALVGSSGCGKSTTVQLVERFYDTAEGSVKLDGMDIKTLNVSWLRSQMGLVSQEPVLFGTSIQENIAYGDNSRDVPMDEIIAAARSANIHEFISTLPDGYETNCGDKGTQLSGGQKQRIAIARALVRNPRILLLDEATSALDTESEKVVQEALDRARSGRTSIVIAHRLSTIQNADQIVVIHNGQVVEQGTHSELLALKGFYYRLHNVQLRRK